MQDGRATPSQTDLLALLAIGNKLAVLGIEAKVDESFGPLVSEWLENENAGKRDRLARLCNRFKVEPANVGHLRYQLFHGTAASLLEAKRFRTETAILIIQSFCPKATGLNDASEFFAAIGLPGLETGKLLGPKKFEDVDLWVGWASDCCEQPVDVPDISH